MMGIVGIITETCQIFFYLDFDTWSLKKMVDPDYMGNSFQSGCPDFTEIM